MKIVFPELNNPVISEAIEGASGIEIVRANTLEEAGDIVSRGEADALIAGIDYTSRDVILTCRDKIGVKGNTFTSCFVMNKGSRTIIIADVATCKNPTEDQLIDIVLQTYETANTILDEDPRIAMLSFSTFGSGGHDDSMTRIQNVVGKIKQEYPEISIDGEMQLDAAVNSEVGKKKAPNSLVAGNANVLICPDLNSANILYKSMEQFGGFAAAGPILQGFKAPASDLSRGSTAEDVLATIRVVQKLVERSKNG